MSRVPILLVEDDPDDVVLARRALQHCGVAIDVAVAGSEYWLYVNVPPVPHP